MGEAKRWRESGAGPRTVYHHTSTLRTNLIWMSGVIGLEGTAPRVWHPHLGELFTDVLMRRAMKDFPPLAWFTSQIEVPQCLIKADVFGIDKAGKRVDYGLGAHGANVLALNRMALGFPITTPGIMHWPAHPGYATAEGRELNQTAIDAGDDPDHWYVSNEPVDVLHSTEIWSSGSILNPKLERTKKYLNDVHAMVRACREQKGVFIPPTWLTAAEVRMLASAMGVSMRPADELGT